MPSASQRAAPRFLLITGCDTGVGKTLVATGLGAALAGAGRRVLAVKPVESGCGERVDAGEDGARLAAATEQAAPRAALVRLHAPLAPPLAAEREARALDPAAWEVELRQLGAGQELVLVEGAGGLRSPLAWGYDARHLARALGAAALVVGADRLGVINQVLLTLEALAAGGVPTLGVVLSAAAAADASSGSNATALARCGVAPVASLPRVAGHQEAAVCLAPVVAWVTRWLDEGGVPGAAQERAR
jgi:dethiobiotin synthetase